MQLRVRIVIWGDHVADTVEEWEDTCDDIQLSTVISAGVMAADRDKEVVIARDYDIDNLHYASRAALAKPLIAAYADLDVEWSNGKLDVKVVSIQHNETMAGDDCSG